MLAVGDQVATPIAAIVVMAHLAIFGLRRRSRVPRRFDQDSRRIATLFSTKQAIARENRAGR